MKKVFKPLCAGLILLTMGFCAHAGIITTGTVTAGRTVSVPAHAGGTVARVDVQAGTYIEVGESIAHLSLVPVYAPCDGTVETVFAFAGESADAAMEKYQGILSIRPESKYTLYATAEYAYQSIRTQTISVGQTVYLKCTVNGTHRGTGRITHIDGEIFTIEALGGEFYTGETVYVYMEDDYEYADRLGKATVVATPAECVPATGGIANMYVASGDFVENGQLLFETIGALSDEGLMTPLTAHCSGYIMGLSVQPGQEIARDSMIAQICPAEDLILTAEIPEADIAGIHPGDSVTAGFELAEETLRLTGTVSHISYLPTEGGMLTYQVRIDIGSDARIAPGMTAFISIGN